MLSVLLVHLPSDIPIVGCELTPYLLLRRPDKTVTTDDVPESAHLGGHFLRYKWYRIQSDRNVAVCSIHPSEQATLQCLGCLKAKIPVAKSYHCSPKCFSDAWKHHRVLHDHAVNENGNEEEVIFGRFNSTGSDVMNSSISGSASSGNLTNGSIPLYPAAVTQRSGEMKLPAGHPNTVLTSRVIPAPSPIPRHLIPVSGADMMGQLDSDGRVSSSGTFTVLSYNILSGSYASNIVCLQAVQNDHFEEFFAPELDKYGYQALYKRKTNEVEFNKAAQSLTEVAVQTTQKKAALNRLVRDNVALLMVLEAKFLLLNIFCTVSPFAAFYGKGRSITSRIISRPSAILRPHSKLTYQLPLVSSYSPFARGVGLGLEHQRRKMDITTNEPLFTNCTRDFIGTLDYIFYTDDLALISFVLSADSLTVKSLLELLDEDSLRKDTALPSAEWSSDHIALLAELRFQPMPRR
ncbi:Carbon catabolite repressor protein 4-like protein 1 [Hibiscus syriacus]|uniref:Carbon catabolite repressor protein 4-like protein 1 n=1 Tax=Hibiscus syriacus TaxID=106335 RepID=A0A6A3ACE3_HIBSY|nr:Carbon catabolite repressor protein 4-like protein 1 [Hibiscus syriacus]